MPIRAVMYDAVGTLLEPAPDVATAYARAAARQGLAVDLAEVRLRFRRAFAAEEARDAADGTGRTDEARERRRWQTIVAAVFPDAPRHADLFDDLWQHFARPEHWRVFPDARAALERCRARGWIVGLASNFDARLHALAAGQPDLAEFVGPVCVSSELGWRKPRAEFFAAVEARLGLGPNELLLVGDDPLLDVRAARARGWQAIRINRCRQPLDAALAAVGLGPAS